MYHLFLSPVELLVVEEAREFAAWVNPSLVRAMDRDEVRYPKEYVQEAASRRLLGLRFGREVGGRGLSFLTEMAAIEEIGVLGTSLACLYSLPSIVGEGIWRFGTDYQKERFLAPTLRGERFCAEALTEPRGGSDFFGATTTAEEESDHFILRGQKRFIVGAEGADYFFVYARTGEGRKEITAFLVERDDTVQVEYLYGLLGTRGGGTGRIRFLGTRAPKENVILGKNRGAEVFDVMMVPERMTSAAGAIGMGRAALKVAARYSTRRHAFGRPIRDFQAVSFMIADAVTRLDAARGLVIAAARAVDSQGSAQARGYVRRLVSEAKKAATEAAWDAINKSMQVLGGIGYTTVYPIERYLRDARLAMIWTGTNEIMNLLVQHEYYKELGAPETSRMRDVEADAVQADASAEKDYGV